MSLHFEIFPLFPQTASISHTNKVDNKKIIKELKKLKWKETDYSKKFKMKGKNFVTESFDILSKFKGLEEIFIEHLDLHIKNILKYETGYKIFTCWGTMTEPGGSSRLHYHSNSWLSGIYYPEGDPDFKVNFYDSKTEWFADIPEKYNTFNESVKEFAVNENMLIIFPSSLRHQIAPNNSKKNRYSIAFNLMPNGAYNYTSDSQLNLTINK